MSMHYINSDINHKQEVQKATDITHYTLFPEYAIHSDDIEGKSKYNLRLLKEQTLKKLQNEIESGCVKQMTRYRLSLPTLEAHKKTGCSFLTG